MAESIYIPFKEEARSRREQCAKPEVEQKQGGPKGPDSFCGIGGLSTRCEQAQRDSRRSVETKSNFLMYEGNVALDISGEAKKS